MNIFENTVTLRGFLGRDAEAPAGRIESDSCAVLLLATVSGTWDIGDNDWTPHTEWHRVICPGPWFCGFTRGMRRGDYVEVAGELRALDEERGVAIGGERFPVRYSVYAVHASHIRRLERPLAVVDTSDSG